MHLHLTLRIIDQHMDAYENNIAAIKTVTAEICVLSRGQLGNPPQ